MFPSNSSSTSSSNITMTSDIKNDNKPLLEIRMIASVIIIAVSAALSISGSSCIIIMALRNSRQTVQRILIAMSVSDIILSLSLLLSPFLLPSEMGGGWGASIGNFASCSAIGFTFILGFNTGILYNTFLSVCYFASVRYNWRNKPSYYGSFFLPWWEVAAHGMIIGLPLAFGILGLVLKAINPQQIMPVCFYEMYPWGCEENETSPPCYAKWQYFLLLSSVGAMVLFVALIIGISATVCLYVTVQNKLKLSQQLHRASTRLQPSEGFERNQNSTNMSIDTGTSSRTMTGTNSNSRDILSDDRGRRQFDDRLRQVRNQAVLYSLVMANTWMWPVILSGVTFQYTAAEKQEIKSDPGHIALHLLTALFMPLQGFLNFFIYTRQKFKSRRSAYPDKNRVGILYNIVAGKEIPPEVAAAARRREKFLAMQRALLSKQSSKVDGPVALSIADSTEASQIRSKPIDNTPRLPPISVEDVASFSESKVPEDLDAIVEFNEQALPNYADNAFSP